MKECSFPSLVITVHTCGMIAIISVRTVTGTWGFLSVTHPSAEDQILRKWVVIDRANEKTKRSHPFLLVCNIIKLSTYPLVVINFACNLFVLLQK